MKLNTARIFVRDLETAQAFYRDTLGIPQRSVDTAGNELQLVQSRSAG